MKKIFSFLILALVLTVFACTLPSEIGIRGSIPGLKFETRTNFGEMFKDMVKNSFSGDGENDLTMLECVNSQISTQTYLVHMNAINTTYPFTFDFDAEEIKIDGKPFDISVPLVTDIDLFDSSVNSGDESITLPLSSFTDILTGFQFNSSKIKAMLYIKSEDEIAKHANIDLTFKDKTGSDSPIEIKDIKFSNRNGSGIGLGKDTYDGSSLPPGGEIEDFGEIINKKKDFDLDIKVVIPSGTSINSSLFNGDAYIDITVEFVIWLPMELVAIGPNAEISLSDSFGGVGEFIDSVSEYMESLTLTVGMTKNPFVEGKLVMAQTEPHFYISNSLGERELKFPISDSNMKIIKNMDNFKPEVKIEFPVGARVEIPKNFESTSISLEAKINYMILEDKKK